jgi:hypothetical protein
MPIYNPVGKDGFEELLPTDDSGYQVVREQLYTGRPARDVWKPVEMKLFRTSERGKKLRESDAPFAGMDVLFLRKTAADALRDILRDDCEILPVRCAEDDFVVLNPLVAVDALDEVKSQIHRSPSGVIMDIREHVLDPRRLPKSAIFLLSTTPVSATYVTDEFVAAWKSHELRGLDFDVVWRG